MSDQVTQHDRILAVDSPLGQDKLLLRRFSGAEHLSQMFRFQLDMLSLDHNIDQTKIVGKNVTFRIAHEGTSDTRFFNGYVSHFEQGLTDGDFSIYGATIVPWFWFLTRTSDLRIFQNKSAVDIVEQVFEDFSFKDYEISGIAGSHPKREFCVQYRETAANFVSRLLEEEGIFYFFRHENGKHTMVMGDNQSAHTPVPHTPRARFELSTGGGANPLEPHVQDWRHSKQIRPGAAAMQDYNFKKPKTNLGTNLTGTKQQEETSALATYEYPGIYDNLGDGNRLVRTRLEEHEAAYAIHSGSGNLSEFTAGRKFTLVDHPRRLQNRGYVLTSVVHEGAEPTLMPSGTPPVPYANRFTCIPDDVPFRPERSTPKPTVRGVQTAVVVGPNGEEIYTDEYGRVKVQFHWDRDGKKDEKSSCWIRCAQTWAGKGWGMMAIPRIGMEVIVDYLEGDPDRPIILGCVYNAETTPPYKLPGEQNRMTLKSLSTKGGGGSNEIRLDDTKSSEQIFMNATKDMHLRVAEEYVEAVGKDRHESTTMSHTESIGINKELTVGANYSQTITGNMSVTTGLSRQETVGLAYTMTAGAAVTIQAGASLVLEAGASITLRVGPSFININPLGIMIVKPGPGIPIPGIPAMPMPTKPAKKPDTADAGKVQDKGDSKQRQMKKPNWGKHAMQGKALKAASKSGAPHVPAQPSNPGNVW